MNVSSVVHHPCCLSHTNFRWKRAFRSCMYANVGLKEHCNKIAKSFRFRIYARMVVCTPLWVTKNQTQTFYVVIGKNGFAHIQYVSQQCLMFLLVFLQSFFANLYMVAPNDKGALASKQLSSYSIMHYYGCSFTVHVLYDAFYKIKRLLDAVPLKTTM